MDQTQVPGETAVTATEVTTETKHTFGLDSFNKQTPMFAKNLFIVFYSMNTSILAWLGLTKIIPPNALPEVVYFFKFIIDPLCYIISRMWGVTAIQQEKQE